MRQSRTVTRRHTPGMLLLMLLLLAFLLGVVPIAHATGYSFTVLDVPFAGARDTEALGLNNSGKIVGRYYDSTLGIRRGFLYDGGVFTRIDPPFPNSSIFYVDTLNDSDKIVGEYFGSDGRGNGFLDTAGMFQVIDFPGALATGAFGINNSDQIVGDYRDSTTRRLLGLLRTFSSDLVAAYGFNEGSGTTAADSSGNGNTGTLIHSPTWTTGKVGSALSFNGVNQYVRVANAPSLNLTGNIAITAWVKGLSTNYENAIVAKHNGEASWDYELWIPNNGVIQFWADGLSPVNVTSTVAVPDTTQWHHVAVTRNNGTVTFYLDGSPAGSASMTGTFHTNASPVDIGCDGPTCNSRVQLLNGTVDEVRIYNRALSASEIQTVMNATSATTPPPQLVPQFLTIDVPGTRGSTASAINATGQIVGGFYDSTGQEHGFLYTNGQFSTIDVPGASWVELEGINQQGQIVGIYGDSTGLAHGVLYSQGVFQMINVPFPGASDTGAYGINNLGEIVGSYVDSTGTHGFIATPSP